MTNACTIPIYHLENQVCAIYNDFQNHKSDIKLSLMILKDCNELIQLVSYGQIIGKKYCLW